MGIVVAVAAVTRRPASLFRDAAPSPPAAAVRRLRELLPAEAGHEDAVNGAAQALRLRADEWSDTPSAIERLRDTPFDDTLPALRAASRDDYEAGRTVSVVGWVISRTEAELIALLR